MRLPRLAFPVMAVLVIALVAGVATTALVAARAQQAAPSPSPVVRPAQVGQPDTAAPAPAATPAPAPTVHVRVPTKPALGPAGPSAPVPLEPGPLALGSPALGSLEKELQPKSAPKTVQDRGPKGARVPPGSDSASPSQAVSKPGWTAGTESEQGKVYTWQDGGRTMTAVLQEDLVVRGKSAAKAGDVVVAGEGDNSIVRKRYTEGVGDQPVFRSGSGGGLMSLPGGVMLALDPGWDEAVVDKFFAGNDIPAGRITPLEWMDNGFFVETAPGFPSLELANSLAAQEGVVVSSPNWWREVEAK